MISPISKIIFRFVTLLFWSFFPLFAISAKPTSVLVIGGGPAGLATAIEAWENGADVTIVEKRNVYSRPQVVFLLDDSITLLEKWKVDVPKMRIADLRENGKLGFVSINHLEEALARRTAELGIKAINGEFHRLDQKQAVIKSRGREIHIPYDVLVAADGMHSPVRNELEIPCHCLGKAMGIWTAIIFNDPAEKFEISPAIEKKGFFVRKMSVSQASVIFTQSSVIEKISPKEFAALVRDCGWEREAEAIAESKAKIFDGIEIALQQACTFSSENKSAILVGDAAATASFFQGLGANTAFKTASITGEFFKKLKADDEDAYHFFNQKMKEVTDSLIEDSKFLFSSN
jgi:2-polyprenyl-6-methoxyphenol hydroxylase-like FAD-dependent oxidoreductase